MYRASVEEYRGREGRREKKVEILISGKDGYSGSIDSCCYAAVTGALKSSQTQVKLLTVARWNRVGQEYFEKVSQPKKTGDICKCMLREERQSESEKEAQIESFFLS